MEVVDQGLRMKYMQIFLHLKSMFDAMLHREEMASSCQRIQCVVCEHSLAYKIESSCHPTGSPSAVMWSLEKQW